MFVLLLCSGRICGCDLYGGKGGERRVQRVWSHRVGAKRVHHRD